MLLRLRKVIVLVLIIAFLGSLYAWWRRDDLLGWYYFEKLGSADESQRDIWVKKLIGMDEAILPRAVGCLRSPSERCCTDAEEVLAGLARNWKDLRVGNVLRELAAQFNSLSSPGKNAALRLARMALEERGAETPIAFLCGLGRDLLECAGGEAQAERPMLQLAALLLQLEPGEPPPPPLLEALAEQGLRSVDCDLRVLALRLILLPPLSKNADLLIRVVPFLQDASADVRRVALLAVGSKADLVAEDELLPLLHDADQEVCSLCEVALRGRGLDDQHMMLARLISDERPLARLEVLERLQETRDLAPGVWLRKLCRDASPAVRAAAARAAANHDDLLDRLSDMARNDASPTVRQLASHYLRRSRFLRAEASDDD